MGHCPRQSRPNTRRIISAYDSTSDSNPETSKAPAHLFELFGYGLWKFDVCKPAELFVMNFASNNFCARSEVWR